jgi:type I restriction enzyme S subunit
MVRNWKEMSVAELQAAGALLVEDGNHGENRPRPDEFSTEGIQFIRAADMDSGRVLFEQAQRINEVARQRVRKGIGAGGDVLLSHKGTVGKVAFVPLDAPPFVCSPQTTFWRIKDPEQLDRRYIYFYLLSRAFREQLDSRKGETDMADYVSLTTQRTLKVTVPPLAQQKAIAAVLGALDDKIELNRRMNATLEAMARALFQSWFVDFDPVRQNQDRTQNRPAPAASRYPPPVREGQGEGRFALGAAATALFPDSFQDSVLGPIPFGWDVHKLKDLTNKIGSGATPRGGSEVYVDEGPALIRSQNVYDHEFNWAGLAHLTEKSATELKNVEVMRNDVLLNITGDSILRTCVVDPAVLPARVNQHVAIIRALEGIPSRYLHLYLVQESMKAFLIGMSAGATRHAITKGHLESVDVLRPSTTVLAAFEKLTTPWFEQVDANRAQSRTLATLRDTLLPKLLSGELSVTGIS